MGEARKVEGMRYRYGFHQHANIGKSFFVSGLGILHETSGAFRDAQNAPNLYIYPQRSDHNSIRSVWTVGESIGSKIVLIFSDLLPRFCYFAVLQATAASISVYVSSGLGSDRRTRRHAKLRGVCYASSSLRFRDKLLASSNRGSGTGVLERWISL